MEQNHPAANTQLQPEKLYLYVPNPCSRQWHGTQVPRDCSRGSRDAWPKAERCGCSLKQNMLCSRQGFAKRF